MSTENSSSNNIVSLDSYRKSNVINKERASTQPQSVKRLEAELVYRTGKIAEVLDEHQARIENLERTISEMVKAIRILSLAVENHSKLK